jgi:pheromone shutdown-related protein TraB
MEHESADLHALSLGEREILLIGTAHVSAESAGLVRRVIDERRPDRVCVELDAQRYEALLHPDAWRRLDLRQVIKRRQLPALMANLVLGSYQSRIGERLGVAPGAELLEAVRAAEASGIPVSLCDRDIRTTVLRAWRAMSLWQRSKLLALLLSSFGSSPDLTEDDLRELRRTDVMSGLLRELATAMPGLKRALIDERDTFLAERIRVAEGRRIVAVIGAGHVLGVREALLRERPVDLDELSRIPAPSLAWRLAGWAIPVSILASLVALAWTQGVSVARDSLELWILATGIPCALGAVVALSHPLTILASFVAAPITTLSPVLGAGYVTAFVQAYVQPPLVSDFETVKQDAGRFVQWWRNRLLRVLLAFVFPTVGAIIGVYIGGLGILRNLF